ncbi:MAG: glycosyltransferase 87 family protein [Oscillospiraceae bacterium]
MQKSKNEIWVILAVILGFSLMLRFIIGIGYFNSYDTFWYRSWAVDLPNGLFNVYARAESISLDYPPLYLFFLYPIGVVYNIVGLDCNEYTSMFLMKFWPIVFDVLCSLMLYIALKKYSSHGALLAAALWAMNPSAIFNSAMWGQTDGMMVFFLILSFWLLFEKKPIAASVAFAVAGMIKYQCLFFTPVFLLQLWQDFKVKRFLYGVAAAAAAVIAVFLPFMIASKKPFLFLETYFGGAGKYPHCTLNAYNIYGIFRLNWEPDTFKILGPLTVAHLSLFFVILSIALIFFIYLKGKRTCPFVASFLFMQCLFMLMSRMHERYQIVVLPFALIAFVIHRRKDFLWLFASLSAITAINQAVVLFNVRNKESFLYAYSGSIMTFFSIINLIVFIWSVYACMKFFFEKQEENQDEAYHQS